MRSGNMLDARKLSFAGILAALDIICLFLAVTLPTGRISLYALSSFAVSVVVIEAGVKAGWAFYAATGILSAILLQNKLGVVPYVLFFGVYGLLKYYIEKTGRLWLEIILKLASFNILLAAAFAIARELLAEGISARIPWAVLVILLQVVFIAYDYVYTLGIQYYIHKIRSRLRLG